ncbi:MAG TPA: hypothetical protein VGK86_15075 [Thermoanaerobaculia bacterium]
MVRHRDILGERIFSSACNGMRPARFPFAGKMLVPMEKVRRLRGVRIAMLVAACLGACAAFGLHPEPASAPSDPALAIRGATAAIDGPASHDCLACRAHRPLLSTQTSADVTGPQTFPIRPVAPRPLAVRVFPVLSLDGRSPPLAS